MQSVSIIPNLVGFLIVFSLFEGYKNGKAVSVRCENSFSWSFFMNLRILAENGLYSHSVERFSNVLLRLRWLAHETHVDCFGQSEQRHCVLCQSGIRIEMQSWFVLRDFAAFFGGYIFPPLATGYIFSRAHVVFIESRLVCYVISGGKELLEKVNQIAVWWGGGEVDNRLGQN